MNLLIQVLIFLVSFVVLWFASGLIVTGVDVFTKRLKISPFIFSFFVLGILTSIPEIAVGVSAVIDKSPQIFVGNLLGGQILMFLLVIPLLAVVGGGIKLVHQFSTRNFLLLLVVTGAPAYLTYGGQLNLADAAFMVFLYILLLVFLQSRKQVFDGLKADFTTHTGSATTLALQLVVGVTLIIVSSKLIVDATVYFSGYFQTSPFLISLFVLSLGTNLPELTLAIRSVFSGRNETAFGDYLGSAVANTFLLGIFTLLHGRQINIQGDLTSTLIFATLGLLLFYFFSRSKREISRVEGIILLTVYVLFILFELL